MMLFLPVWWKWLHRKRRKELLEIMSEQNRQEEAARNDRQRLEQQAVESRQLSERALAEERQRQEIRRMQDEQRRQDSQRQEEQRRQDEQRRQEETRRKEENSQRKDDKTPQSQELRDLANTEDKYMRLVKSGYYDEKRAEKAAEKTEGGNGMEQMKKAPTKGGFSERREALKTKVQDALRKQEHSKTHDIGHSR